MDSKTPTREAAIEDAQALIAKLLLADCCFTLRHEKKVKHITIYVKDDTNVARMVIGGRLDVTSDSHAQVIGSLEIVYI